MAISSTKKSDITLGNKLMKIYTVDFDSVTGGLIPTGLQRVEAAIYIPQTSDKHGITYLNSATASETEDDFGDVYVDDVTANDNGTLVVIGY
jgi:hypothetical protein